MSLWLREEIQAVLRPVTVRERTEACYLVKDRMDITGARWTVAALAALHTASTRLVTGTQLFSALQQLVLEGEVGDGDRRTDGVRPDRHLGVRMETVTLEETEEVVEANSSRPGSGTRTRPKFVGPRCSGP